MFKSSFKYSIDAKGRVSIPAKIRKFVNPEANDTFIMTRGTVKCIDVTPLDLWKEVEEKLNKLNPYDPKNSFFLRMFLSEAYEDKLDSQGRLLIPRNLIEHAEIDREAFIIGINKKIEIWNPQNYEAYIKNIEFSYEEIAQNAMR